MQRGARGLVRILRIIVASSHRRADVTEDIPRLIDHLTHLILWSGTTPHAKLCKFLVGLRAVRRARQRAFRQRLAMDNWQSNRCSDYSYGTCSRGRNLRARIR